MSIVDRAKNILLTPKTEWPIIAAEPATVNSLFTGYALILALIPLAATILGGFVFGSAFGLGGMGLSFVLVPAIISYILGLFVVWLMGIISAALAPSFDGKKDSVAGTKLIVYASTPVWVLGILGLVPGLNIIAMIVGLGYGIYLIYLGSTSVLGVPEAKAVGLTAVVVIVWILLTWVLTLVIMGAVMSAMFGGAMFGAAALAS